VIEALRLVIQRLLDTHGAPIVVALDGPSGAGKSTMASALAAMMAATVITSDDFFAAEITATEWAARTPAERARDAIDWRRLRRLALEPLRAGRPAIWQPFDFASGERADGSYGMGANTVQRQQAPVIILEGAYVARPELADLIDCAMLIDTPVATREKRLAAREDPAFLAAWHDRWDAAEAYYFTAVRPPVSFDIVVDTATATIRACPGR
jgi:uridine kinase